MAIRLIKGNTQKNYPVGHIGGKGQGLIKLKRLERVLQKKYSRDVLNEILEIPNFFISPVGDNTKNKDSIYRYLDSLQTDKFAVRSSAPLEDGIEHSFEGVYESFLNVSQEEVIDAIESVKASALGEKAIQYSKDFNVSINSDMAVIVQKMATGKENGIIYSKFPSSKNISKMIHQGEKNEIGVVERIEMYGSRHIRGKIITMDRFKNDELENFINISHEIEKEFGCPVRIEYNFNKKHNEKRGDSRIKYHPERFSLLQARPIVKSNKLENIVLPEIEDEKLVAGTYEVNGEGNFTLPAVVIFGEDRGSFHIPEEEIIELNQKYHEGYVLIANYLTFGHWNVDALTYNKKAAITSGNGLIGGSPQEMHDWDIARQKNLLYLNIEDFKQKFNEEINEVRGLNSPVKTGDLIRVVSDGAKGLIYKID